MKFWLALQVSGLKTKTTRVQSPKGKGTLPCQGCLHKPQANLWQFPLPLQSLPSAAPPVQRCCYEWLRCGWGLHWGVGRGHLKWLTSFTLSPDLHQPWLDCSDLPAATFSSSATLVISKDRFLYWYIWSINSQWLWKEIHFPCFFSSFLIMEHDNV